MEIPANLRAGDTWSWTDTLTDYPAGTWTLKYALRGYQLTPVDIVSTPSVLLHACAVAADETAGVAPGRYDWAAFVERTVGGVLERITVASGSVNVLPALFAAKSTTDTRTIARKMLDNINDAIQRLVAREVVEMTVNGRTVTYADLGKLLKERRTLEVEVENEEAAARGETGVGAGMKILTRFVSE